MDEIVKEELWSVAGFFVLLSLTFIVLLLMGISLKGEVSDESLIWLGFCSFFLVASLIWYHKLRKVK